MNLTLQRNAYTETETQGLLFVNGQIYHTVELPWLRYEHPGGRSGRSCVPDGEYDLVPFTRPNGDKVLALINPDHGVWLHQEDRPNPWGRFLILIHAGNTVDDIAGCIAPGLERIIYKKQVFVTNSKEAMSRIMTAVEGVRNLTLSIVPAMGAVD